jgi:hypothetical protein
LIAWLLLGAVRISPDPLAYFHELAGGPTRGDRFLVDSNLDWGQDDARLRRWIGEWTGNEHVSVNPSRPVAGVVAANVNALHGVLSRDDRRLRWLNGLPVSHRIGHCWRVYVVDEARLRDAARRSPIRALDYARWLEGTGRPSDALEVLAANDLSRHARHAGEWFSLRAEARLATGDLSLAAEDVARVDDPDLALVLAYRAAEAAGASPETWSPSLRAGIVGALARRDQWSAANDVCRRLTGRTLEELDEPGSLARAIRWRGLGREREALAIAGEVLARDPTNEDALWLYGELVVRRKLGLTNYDLPDVDWSGSTRRDLGL